MLLKKGYSNWYVVMVITELKGCCFKIAFLISGEGLLQRPRSFIINSMSFSVLLFFHDFRARERNRVQYLPQ